MGEKSERKFPAKFEKKGKQVEVFPADRNDQPLIVLNMYGEAGSQIWAELSQSDCTDFNLVIVSNLQWDHDMAPWAIPAISDDDVPCTAGADDYLKTLLEDILPVSRMLIRGEPVWLGLGGYSLGGLFAVYATYRTDVFTRIASISGSLWFPGFRDFVLENSQQTVPTHMYFSLGDRESKTRNPFLHSVQRNTGELEEYYRKSVGKTIFELNPGNHYQQPVQRIVRALQWLLRE